MGELFIGGGGRADGRAELHFMDYLATRHRVNSGGHGYGGMFCLSLFDKHWVPNMSRAQAMDLVDKCVAEVAERLVAPTANIW